MDGLDQELETIVLGIGNGDVQPCLTRNGEARSRCLTSDLTVDARLDDDREGLTDQTTMLVVGVLTHGCETALISREAVDIIMVDNPVDDGRSRRIVDASAERVVVSRSYERRTRCEANNDLSDAILIEEIAELRHIVDVLDRELVYHGSIVFIAGIDKTGVAELEVAIDGIASIVNGIDVAIAV